MKPMLLAAIIAITLALILYTIGVFSERHAKVLKPMHLALFWLGLICDSTGTALMSKIAQAGATGIGLHAVTGALAIVLMAFHAIWATVTLVSHNEKRARTFHRLSLFVWLVWLVPYVIGVYMGMH
ncbi:TIGR03987 family protein [Coriobacteriaceae bacterium BV3Ac1]|nr:TIGR03987 family protein [Coriobacteriaceae bacterium BV3Ac1]